MKVLPPFRTKFFNCEVFNFSVFIAPSHAATDPIDITLNVFILDTPISSIGEGDKKNGISRQAF
jgi:hypothetical protein